MDVFINRIDRGEASTRTAGRSEFVAYVEVALPLPLTQTFTYGVSPGERIPGVGTRVRVSFTGRWLVGCTLSVQSECPRIATEARILPIGQVLDEESILTPEQIRLVQWLVDYYLAAPGLVCRSMMPPDSPRGETIVYEKTAQVASAKLREGGAPAAVLGLLEEPKTASALKRALSGHGVRAARVDAALRSLKERGLVSARAKKDSRGGRTIRTARISDEGRKALSDEKRDSLSTSAIRVLTLLSVATNEVPLASIRAELSVSYGLFRRLEERGYLTVAAQIRRESPWARVASYATQGFAAPTLTEAQQEIVDRVTSTDGQFDPVVVYGVTGSGKTEVYLRAAERVLEIGRNVLMLVPEIALTPKLAGLLRARFGEKVALVHSALGSGERRDEWWRIRRGEARVVVGARAAVLTPLQNVGLIVVDEEHESSYKQEESPRYNARDVALVRGRDEKASVLLGSATPSLESFQHASSGRYRLERLPDRIADRKLAAVHFVDMKDAVKDEGPEIIVAKTVRDAIAERLKASEQALVLLNRRGWAGQLTCRACGLGIQCKECSVSMTLHRRGELAVCHYCGLGRETPTRCDTCGGEYLKRRGFGTERLEEHLKELFPSSTVARMDRDTTRKKGSLESLLSRFEKREIDVLVGTQMLAKGHDFPAVTLVGVLAADASLSAPDFRAAERTFQILTQVSGRAGRGMRAGEVFIQSFAPEHYALQFAQAQDYLGFYANEQAFRKGLWYPPFVHVINLVFEAESMARAMTEARRVASFLRNERLDEVQILGPAFAVRSKIANMHRCQVLLKTSRKQHARVRSLLRSVQRDPDTAKVLNIDVDPMDLS